MKKGLIINAILVGLLILTNVYRPESIEVVVEQPEVTVEEIVIENTEVEEQEIEDVEVTSRGGEIREGNGFTGYQITSYHPGDGYGSGTRTGSGKSINNFDTMEIGNKTVYTYDGKVVVAAATEELYNTGYSVRNAQVRQDGKHYFRYYDELQINIDGTYYDAIVLDSCGAAMWEGELRIDIFVPTSSDIINRSNVDILV